MTKHKPDSEVEDLFKYPIMQALARRRSRRFPLGCNLSVGGFQHRSSQQPVALNDLELAFLCWAGAGITGSIVGDIPSEMGGKAFGSWIGRTIPLPCNVYNTRLFFTNDNGTYMYNPVSTGKMVEIETVDDLNRIAGHFQDSCIKVLDQRVEFAERALLGAMHWNINRPGTTVFIPVVDQSEEYIDFLLTIFDSAGNGYRLYDNMRGKWAGLESLIESGGLKGPRVEISSFEYNVMVNNLAPAYFMIENIHLLAEAMGLGSVVFGGYTGQVMLGITSMSKGLGFTAQKGNDGRLNPVGLDNVFEAFCPPYYKDMSDAVDAVVEKKFGEHGHFTQQYDGVRPFKDWKNLQKGYSKPAAAAVRNVKAYCSYVYETYGRIPATTDTKLLPIWLQVHHLDLDFYKTHFADEVISDAQRTHMARWHK